MVDPKCPSATTDFVGVFQSQWTSVRTSADVAGLRLVAAPPAARIRHASNRGHGATTAASKALVLETELAGTARVSDPMLEDPNGGRGAMQVYTALSSPLVLVSS